MADWKKLLVENPPASDIASSPSSGKVLKVSSNGTGLEWADDAGGAFQIVNGNAVFSTGNIDTGNNTNRKIGDIANDTFLQFKQTQLEFSADNNVAMVVQDTNVGIGTSSPNEALEVSGSIRATSSNSYVDVIDTDSSLKITMRGGNTIGAFGTYSNHPLSIRTDTTERIRITSAGLVGIGNSNPSEKLDVAGGANIDTRLWIGNTHNNGQTFNSMGSQGNELILDGGSNSGLTIVTGASNAGYINHNNYNSGNYQHIKFDSANAGMFFKAGGTDNVLSLKSTGVGIATTNPVGTFSVAPDTDATTTLGRVALHSVSSDFATFSHYDQRSSGVGYALRQSSNGTTALNSAGTNRLNFNINNATQMVLKGDKVGIGTTNPTHGKLEVRGVSNDTTIAIHEDNGTHKAQLHLRSGGNDVKLYTNASDGNNFHIDTEQVSKAFTLAPDGKVGIGAEFPATTLHLDSSSTTELRIQDGTNKVLRIKQQNNGAFFTAETGNSLTFTTNGNTNAMHIDTSQRVGIGTLSPSTSLEISGGSNKGIIVNSTGGVSFITARKDGNQLMIGADGTSGFIKYGNTNTSLARDLRFFEGGGTETMRLTDAGSLGIGTASPSHPLHINSSVSNGQLMQLHNTNNADGTFIKFTGANSTSEDWQLGSGATGFSIYSLTDNAFRFIVANDGKVGIGTSSPVFGLDVRSTGYFATASNVDQIRLGDTTNGKVSSIRTVNDTMQFKPDGSNVKFFIGNTGRIGIGTTSPGQVLHVNGNIRVGNSSHHIFSNKFSALSNAIVTLTSNAGNDISFNAGGPETVRFKDGGNVGIGTTSPSSTLHVVGGIRTQSDNNNISFFLANNTTRLMEFKNMGDNSTILKTSGAYNLRFGTNDVDRLMIQQGTGNVGIGNTNPTEKLHVDGSLRLADNKDLIWSNGTRIIGQSNYIQIQTGSLDAIRIDNSQRVGIGTNSPNGKMAIHSASAGGSSAIFNRADELVIENSDHAGITIKSPTDKETSVFFGDADDSSRSGIRYNHDGDTMTFQVASAKLILDLNSRISLSNNDAGTANTIFGKRAGEDIGGGGNYNAFFGEFAGANISTGEGNVAIGYAALFEANDDGRNTAIGQETLKKFNASGNTYNVAIGHRSNYNRLSGVQNTALGAFSQYGATSGTAPTGSGNTSVGYLTLNNITSGQYNSTLGIQAGHSITTSVYNTYLGYQTGYYNETGSHNVAIGGKAMFGASGQSHSNNTAIGYESLKAITTGGNNTAIGYTALQNNTTATYNLALGYRALRDNTTSGSNVAVGAEALQSHVSGNGANIAIGAGAMQQGSGGKQRNHAIGYRSQFQNDTGIGNISNGYLSLQNNVNGDYNVAIGFESMKSASGNSHSNNVGIGYQSLRNITTATNNSALGYQALKSVTTGSSNVAIGKQALDSATIVTSNVAVGALALKDNVSGNYSTAVGQSCLLTNTTSFMTAVGYNALRLNSSGGANVGFGYNAGYGNNTGSFNTSIGYEAGKGVSNNANSNNTSVGYQALTSITSGGNNIAIGVTPQQFNTTGSHNIGIGQTAIRYNQTGTNNVAIGSYSQRGASGNSHSNNTSVGFNSLYSVTTGGSNVAVGSESGNSITTGIFNTSLGASSLTAVTTNGYNTALGYGAGSGETGSNHVAIGFKALFSGNSSYSNSVVGYQSGMSITTASNNSALGYGSLESLTTGSNNVAIGFDALNSITTATQNVAIGKDASKNVDGNNNVSVGFEALTTGTTVANNVAIGMRALRYNGTGDHNIAIGQEALASSSGNNFSHCIALGFESQKNSTGGTQNVTIGNYSGKEIAGGNYNAFYGYQSGQKATGSSSTLIGYRAGRYATGSYNTVVGNSAMFGEDGNTTGNDNSILGTFAGYNLTTGHSNVLMGRDAGENLTSGYQNIIIGHRAGETATGLQNAVIIGKNAGQAINSGVHGTIAIGKDALKNLTGGQSNTAIGFEAGKTIVGGHSNTMIGYQALITVTSGHENVALGFRSGNNIDTGDSHVLVGNASGTTLTNGRRCTIIGDESDVSASGALNQIVIGQGQTGVADNTAIIGNSAVTDVYMGDNGSSWSTTSDGRLKENIEEWSTGLDAINKLRIVEYNFKEDNPYKYDHKKKRQGIIAQEAIEAIPEMIKDDGEWLSANQEPMIWALVNAVQELTKKVNELETKLNKEN